MHIHSSAKLTPTARGLLVQRVTQQNWPVAKAAHAGGVRRQTAHKWLGRYREEGPAGLLDRSSKPHRMPTETPEKVIYLITRLRRRRKTAWQISQALGIPLSTVSKHLKKQGLGRVWRVDEANNPPVRYEHPRPGDMFHIDAKKIARIEGGVGHRIHGKRNRKRRGAGYEAYFVCVDDCTRLAYVEVQPAENAEYARAFMNNALRWFEAQGITCKRLMSDNAKCYSSHDFRALCAERNIKQCFTRPYRPQTNGKAERFIQTMTRLWAYAHAYPTSAKRAAALPACLRYYNFERPHRGIGKKAPITRLREACQQPA